jgi:sulfite exporter TauE/SafE
MLSNEPLYILMFGSGLFGGFGHCLGMCGPLIATYTLTLQSPDPEKNKKLFRGMGLGSALIYHSGRLMSYSIIGGAMGFTGSFVSVAGSISVFQSMAMALSGIFMVMMGLSILNLAPSILHRFRFLTGITRTMKKVSETGGMGGLFPLGLINGMIPCGLSYTAFIASAGIGASEPAPAIGFLKGMFLLLAFGAGTLPSLLLLSLLVSRGMPVLRKRLYSISGIFMILSGIIFIYRAVNQ